MEKEDTKYEQAVRELEEIVERMEKDVYKRQMVNSGVNTCPKHSPFRLWGEH